jgi:hypothetical protein
MNEIARLIGFVMLAYGAYMLVTVGFSGFGDLIFPVLGFGLGMIGNDKRH